MVGRRRRDRGEPAARRSDRPGHHDLGERAERAVDRLVVAFDHVGSTLAVRLLDRLLDLEDGVLAGQDARYGEEAGLHDGADVPAHARGRRDAVPIDDEHLDVLLDDRLLHLAGQLSPDLVGEPRGVQEERCTVGGVAQHVLPVEEPRVVARDEARALDEVARTDGVRAEAQVRDGDRAGLLGVVDEVALRVAGRLLADDLDRVLVAADGAVRADAEEHRAHHVGRLDVEATVPGEGGVGHVVDDPHGEVVLRGSAAELVEDGLDHRRIELLGREAVAASDDPRPRDELRASGVLRLAQGSDDVQVQGLADGARLLRAIEDGDGAHRPRHGVEEGVDVERAEEPDLDDADLLAARDHPVDGLVRHLGPRAGQHEDALRLRVAVVVEEPVAPPRPGGEALHHPLHDRRAGQVEAVGSLPRLEERVGVLGASAQHGMVGRHRARAVCRDEVRVDERADVVVVQVLDLRDLVRGPEAVEEVEERHARRQRRRVGDERQVVRLLHRARREHREADLTARHHVRVVTEDG